MPRLVSFLVLVGILALFGALFYRVVAGFLLPIFLALVLVVVFRPLFGWVSARCGQRPRLAALVTTILIVILVLGPLLFVIAQAATEAQHTYKVWSQQRGQDVIQKLRQRWRLELPPVETRVSLENVVERLRLWHGERPGQDVIKEELPDIRSAVAEVRKWLDQSGIESGASVESVPAARAAIGELTSTLDQLSAAVDKDEDVTAMLEDSAGASAGLRRQILGRPLRLWLKQQASDSGLTELKSQVERLAGKLALGGTQAVGGFLASFLVGLAIMLVAVYYFFADGPAMLKSLMRLSPLDDRYEQQLWNQFASSSRAVVTATLASAFVQGLLAGVAYFFLGLNSVMLLTVATMLFALIPFIGAAAIWGPCCIWLWAYEERGAAAAVLFFYGALVVSNADNIVKPWILKGQSNVHPLLALLSILGGVEALGPIGILVGPMVVSFLQTLLRMLNAELASMGSANLAAVTRQPLELTNATLPPGTGDST